MEALDALMRPGARACHDCDAATVLIPALERAMLMTCGSVSGRQREGRTFPNDPVMVIEWADVGASVGKARPCSR